MRAGGAARLDASGAAGLAHGDHQPGGVLLRGERLRACRDAWNHLAWRGAAARQRVRRRVGEARGAACGEGGARERRTVVEDGEDEPDEGGVELLVHGLRVDIDVRGDHREVRVRVVPPDDARGLAHGRRQALCLVGRRRELLGRDLDAVV